MRLNISAWSIRNPVTPVLLFAVLALLGTLSFMRLPVTKFPNIDVPVVTVTVTQAGAAPAELETQVTKIVEDAVANLTGVKHMLSTLTDGSSRHRDRVPARGQPGPRPERRQGRDRQHSRRPAAHGRRADHPEDRRRGPVDHLVRGKRAGHDARAAVVARRRRDQARSAGTEGSRPGRAHRRRHPRDPHPARPGEVAGAQHHRRRRQPPGPRDQYRPRLRPRRGRRPGAGDPHPGGRPHRRAARRCQDHHSRRPRSAAERPRPGPRRRQRAALVRQARRRAGRRLLGFPLQGRERAGGRPGGGEARRRAAAGAAGRPDLEDRRCRVLHARQLRVRRWRR